MHYFANLATSPLMNFGQSLLAGIADLCFPPTCVFCQGPIPAMRLPRPPLHYCSPTGARSIEADACTFNSPKFLCNECTRILLSYQVFPACSTCGNRLPATVALPHLSSSTAVTSAPQFYCDECIASPSIIERAYVLGAYREAIREAVIACKQTANAPLALVIGDLLGQLVAQQAAQNPPQLVTCVPSHWTRRLRRRGWPTQWLAKRVANRLGVPLVPLLRSARRTSKQGMLSDKERITNIQGAFAPLQQKKISVDRVLIVDDVWTTGATLKEAAHCIQKHFQVRVEAAVIARAIGDHQVAQ